MDSIIRRATLTAVNQYARSNLDFGFGSFLVDVRGTFTSGTILVAEGSVNGIDLYALPVTRVDDNSLTESLTITGPGPKVFAGECTGLAFIQIRVTALVPDDEITVFIRSAEDGALGGASSGGGGGEVTGEVEVTNFPADPATNTTLATRVSSSEFQARLNTLGAKTSANSSPVVLASDQAPLPVTGPLTDTQLRATAIPVSGSFSVTGGATEVTLTAIDTKTPALGQAAMAASTPVTLASDQTALAVSGTVTANVGTVGTLATAAKQPALGTAGTPSTDVITIQGHASGTPIPITGTIDASNPSVSATGAAIPASATLVGASDGTNTEALIVKAASTAPVAGDRALVVALSPNSVHSTAANQATVITSLQLIDDVVNAINTAFSKAAAIGGQFDDASITAATEDNVAPIRITAQRAVHTNLRNVAGTEIGTLAAPVATIHGYATGTLANGTQNSVTSTAGSIASSNASRKGVIIQNLGVNGIYIGASGVAVTTGQYLEPGGTRYLELSSAVYAITASGYTSTAFSQDIT